MAARTNLVVVARRAMACEFSVRFPAQFRRAPEAGCAALDEIDRLEAKLSVYRGDSDLTYINQAAFPGPVRADAEVYGALSLAARLSAATGGAFDPASGALLKAWGFFQGPKRVPSEAEHAAALEACGMGRVVLDSGRGMVQFRGRGVEFNLGAFGKGYALDAAAGRLREEFGVRSALLEAGGSSVRAIGVPPGEPRGWKVAIGDPLHHGRSVGAVWLRGRALGSSGADHQFFAWGGRRYGHVLDPRTGWPAASLAGATAIAPAAAEADALSTAFFVLGLEGTRRFCREHPGTAAVLVTRPAQGRPPRVVAMGLGESDVEFPTGR